MPELLDRSIENLYGGAGAQEDRSAIGFADTTYCPALLAFAVLHSPRRSSATYMIAIAFHLFALLALAIHVHQMGHPVVANVAIHAATLSTPTAPMTTVEEKVAPKMSPQRNRQQRRLPRKFAKASLATQSIGLPAMIQTASLPSSFTEVPATHLAVTGPIGQPIASKQDSRPSAAQEPSHAAAPLSNPTPDGALAGAKVTWEGEVLAHLGRFRRYPAASRMRHEEGIAYIRFRMDRTGHVLSSDMERTSGFPLLDKEAQATVLRAQPLPAIPPNLPDVMELSLPIEFFLR